MTNGDKLFLRRVVFEETARQLGVEISEINESTLVPNVLSLVLRVYEITKINFNIKRLSGIEFNVGNIIKIFS